MSCNEMYLHHLEKIQQKLTSGYSVTKEKLKQQQIVRFHYSTLISTQIESRKIISLLESDKVIAITADKQTRAIGQYNRAWYSPKGLNIAVSYCFSMPNNHKMILGLSQMGVLAILSLAEELGIQGTFKWPNDAYINQKKFAGILTESYHTQEIDKKNIILGIGINVNVKEKMLKPYNQSATSLSEVLGYNLNREQLLTTLSQKIITARKHLIQYGFTSIHTELESRLERFGNNSILFKSGKDNIIQGTIHGIDEKYGALQLKDQYNKISIHNCGRILT